MATTTLVRGIVRNGRIIPESAVPEGSEVEIRIVPCNQSIATDFVLESKELSNAGGATLHRFLVEHCGADDYLAGDGSEPR